MKKRAGNLRVTASSQYYGNHTYCPPKKKTNVATQKQIDFFDKLLTMAKENGLLSDEKEQELKRFARTKAGFSKGISTLKTYLMKANISLTSGEPIPEDSIYYVKTYSIYGKEQNDEQN